MALLKDVMGSWRDTYTVRRVFGDPIEKDGLTIIPVAMVAGGGGGGNGPADDGDSAANGGAGFGGLARPAGVFVVRTDSVVWHPALDVTLLGMAGMLLAALVALVLGRALRRRW
jgi:uncharacterized spore protein YtfJ